MLLQSDLIRMKPKHIAALLGQNTAELGYNIVKQTQYKQVLSPNFMVNNNNNNNNNNKLQMGCRLVAVVIMHVREYEIRV